MRVPLVTSLVLSACLLCAALAGADGGRLRTPLPDALNCTRGEWCDSTGRCVDVCERGSVRVPAALRAALQVQDRLAALSPTLVRAGWAPARPARASVGGV